MSLMRLGVPGRQLDGRLGEAAFQLARQRFLTIPALRCRPEDRRSRLPHRKNFAGSVPLPFRPGTAEMEDL